MLSDPDITNKQRESETRFLSELENELKATNTQRDIISSRLKTQISSIKETFYAMLDGDSTLTEKIQILCQEQGITIASVLAAISLAISTLVSLVIAAVRGAGTPAVTPEPPAPELPAPKPKPPEPSSIKEWIQKH